MRIIAGDRRGSKITGPKGDTTRPTSDRVREAAYNLIGPVDGAAVLDLFAGSGAMGLEALSRGARRSVFVESDRAACRVIHDNLEKLRFTGALVLQKDVFQALQEERGRTYDLVLVDPPYGSWPDLEPRLAEALPGMLAPDGLLVVETSSRVEPELPLELVTSRRYGSARITLFTQ
ncbi:MAG: 16S rRNA (guanine(966)-N(2))-methyltransferase RsmD [Thermoleophilia bacterium]|nr:16S rRNA (guanine(966)-N(2))-methyltransferase RsmD [Thermoleophilia bacterium]